MNVYVPPTGVISGAPSSSIQHPASFPAEPSTAVSGGYYHAHGYMGNTIPSRSVAGAYPAVVGMGNTMVGSDPYNPVLRRDSFAAAANNSVGPTPAPASVTAGNGCGPMMWPVGNTVSNSNESYNANENVDTYTDGHEPKSWF